MFIFTLTENLEHWSQIIKAFPDQPIGWYERGGIWFDLNRYEEALSDYTTALRIAPGFIACRYCRALTLGRMGRMDDAFEDYSQVIEEDPRYVSAYNNRGIILLNRNKLKEALRDFTAASEIDPSHPRSRYNQGLVMGTLGRHQEAIASFTTALELNPEYLLAFMMRAKAYMELQELDLAEEDLREADERDSGSAEFHSLRARLFFLRGMREECLAEMRLAMEIDPECPELKSLIHDIEILLAQQQQSSEPEAGSNAPRRYPREEKYRELLRPAREHDKARKLMCAFLLMESVEEITDAVTENQSLLNEEVLDYLESVGERNLAIRETFRRKVKFLRSLISDLKDRKK